MQLFYAPDIIPPEHTLSEEESRHAVKVLRLSAGDRLHITDGQGTLFEAEVTDPDPRRCRVRVVNTIPEYGKRPYRLTMAVAPTKNGDRYEWFLEKATETGIDAVVPIECVNSERRVFRPERALRILAGAMKQSLKAHMPVIEPMKSVREVVERPFDGVKLIAHCRSEGEAGKAEKGAAECSGGESDVERHDGETVAAICPGNGRIPVMHALPPATDALILIGPEGDFTAEEVELATSNGFIPISLGDSRLRTETAALAAVMAAYFINTDYTPKRTPFGE